MIALVACLMLAQPGAASAPSEITKETRPELFRDEPPPRVPASQPGAPQQEPQESQAWFWTKMLVRTAVVLVIVVLLAYLILNKGLTRLVKLTGSSQPRTMTIIERMPLGPKHSLFIVEVQGRRLVVGTAEHAISLLADLRDTAPPSAITGNQGSDS
jgi:flagellar protein FliO/FliZ